MVKKLVLFLLLFFVANGCGGPKSSFTKTSKEDLYVAAWYASYDTSRGLNSFLNNIALFNEINPVWYNLNPNYFNTDSEPFVVNPSNSSSILAAAAAHGIKVLPTIQNWGTINFDQTVIRAIIADSTFRAKHVAEIVQLVIDGGYDGIDIDYENLGAGDRDNFTKFLNELGLALHLNQKLLSVALYSKTSDSSNWTGPGAQDWPAIAANVDILKIMAYDYHWVDSHAGPVAPVDWLQAILNYCATIPEIQGKVVIGLPFYGLDWPATGRAREVSYLDAQKLMQTYNYTNLSRASVKHSESFCSLFSENVELHFNYRNGDLHTVYFQDSQALRERLRLIDQYRSVVKGVTFWRLGGEDSGIWSIIGSYKN